MAKKDNPTKRPSYLDSFAQTGQISYSAVAPPIRDELLRLDIVKIEVNRGRRLLVAFDNSVLTKWVEVYYPIIAETNLPARAQNIAQRRDSKAGATTHDVQPVILKWFSADTILPATLTTQFGLVATTTEKIGRLPWPETWNLLLVENWESFHFIEYPDCPIPLIAIYMGGNVADRTLQAVAACAPKRSVFFGDYDWAGVKFCQRIQAILPQTRFYLPADLDGLFACYCNTTLIANAKPVISGEASVMRVVELIGRYNGGLEQEIVPIPAYSDLFGEQCPS